MCKDWLKFDYLEGGFVQNLPAYPAVCPPNEDPIMWILSQDAWNEDVCKWQPKYTFEFCPKMPEMKIIVCKWQPKYTCDFRPKMQISIHCFSTIIIDKKISKLAGPNILKPYSFWAKPLLDDLNVGFWPKYETCTFYTTHFSKKFSEEFTFL